jgi:hypothetical protein
LTLNPELPSSGFFLGMGRAKHRCDQYCSLRPNCTDALRRFGRSLGLALQLPFHFEVCSLRAWVALRQSDHAMMRVGWFRFRASLMAIRRTSWIDQRINDGVAKLLFLPWSGVWFFLAMANCLLALASISPAEAKGCIKGAIVGGVAGHMAGHGELGAAAGCAIEHH